MEAVPRLPMISCDIKISPNNTEFGYVLKKYIRDHYREDPESYSKEIKELETLRQNAIKAPLDFTGCSILKRYYAQLHKLQSRFPMTDDGPACVPFMWTDIYSGVAYNITDIEYEEACILYNIGALHSKLGTMDSRSNAEGMKIACTHFQCAAWAFQHLRDTYPQPKGSDMSHDLLTFFINIMLAQAQECILEKSMLDNRKSSITAKIAAQVVDYYKCALGIMVSGSPSTDTGSVLDIVGHRTFKGWKKFIEFKMSYYASISHLYMGNQAEENQKWGERVSWYQSAFDHLTEAIKIAKSVDREDLNEPLTFTMDVVGGKHNSSKKENEFVYHDKVPALSSLPELKGASLVKGIPFSATDPEVSGPDIFARLVPMEAHETSSLYSEEKAKLLRSMVARIEGKNEELMAYLSSLQLESGLSFDDEGKIPQELLEKCAAMSVRPNAITDLQELVDELLTVSKEVDACLKSTFYLLAEDEKKELQHQEAFGKRMASPITSDLKRECSKYEEAHKKAIESNNTLETAVKIHIDNMSKLLLPLEELRRIMPSTNSIKTPENIKNMNAFNHLVDKVDEMREQRQYLEQQLRDSLMKDDITKTLVTLKKKEDMQEIFIEEMKKHSEVVTYLDQNLAAQDNILCALTEANAHYADTRKALTEIQQQRHEMALALINSVDAYDDLVSKAKKGLEFYQKLQTNVNRLLTRARGVVKVQDEERTQTSEIAFRKGQNISRPVSVPSNVPPQQVPKLKDYLPYMTKQGGTVAIPPGLMSSYPPPQQPVVPSSQVMVEPMRQATLGGPAIDDSNLKLQPFPKEAIRPDASGVESPSMGVRPTPVGSEQTSVPAMCTTGVSNTQVGSMPYPSSNEWSQIRPPSYPANFTNQYPTSVSNITSSQLRNSSLPSQNYGRTVPTQNGVGTNQYTPNIGYQQHGPSVPSLQTQQSVSGYPNATSPSVPTSFAPVPTTSLITDMKQIPIPGSVSHVSGTQASIVGAPNVYQYPGSVSYGSSYIPPNAAFNTTTQVRNLPPSQAGVASQPVPPTQAAQVSWQVLPTGQYVPASGYSTQTSTYDLKQAPNPSAYQSHMQYYPSNSQPNSTSISAVTADTRTSTYNVPQSSNTQSSTGYPSNMPLYNNQAHTHNYITASGSGVTALPSNVAVTYSNQVSVSYPNNYVNTSASSNQVAYYSSAAHPNSQVNPTSTNIALSKTPSAISSQVTSTSNAIYAGAPASMNAVANPGYIAIPTSAPTYVPAISSQVNPNMSSQVNPNIQTQVNPNVPYTGSYSRMPTASVPQASTTAQNPYAGTNASLSQSSIPNGQGTIQNFSPGVSLPQGMQVASGYYYTGGMANSQGTYNSTAYVAPSASSAGYVNQQNYVSPTQHAGIVPSTSVTQLGYVAPSNAVTQPGYVAPSNAVTQPGYISPPTAVTQPGFVSPPNTGSQPGYVLPSNTATQPSYALPSNAATHPGYVTTQPSYVAGTIAPNTHCTVTSTAPKVLPQTSPTPAQPLQPLPLNNTEPKSSLSIADSSNGSANLNAIRDLITPPLEEEPVRPEKSEPSTEILQPKIIDLKSISQPKEKEPLKDPLDDPNVRAKFVSEVEKYEKFVDGLVRKSLNGTTPLDQKWKELMEVQDKESRKLSISVARCYPLKNRYPDIMPYDSNRVQLVSAKDDYINASYLKDICPVSPVFVLTQSPLPVTYCDFWLMVWEQQVETLICLSSDFELKNHIYFPKERGQTVSYGVFEMTVQSCKEKNGFVERMINIAHTKNRSSRVVVHLQFSQWPGSGIPQSPAPLLQFVSDALFYQKQQRNLMRPVVVHCSSGVGRSGCFCLITALVNEMNGGHGPRDVAQVVSVVSQQRKFLIQDKEQVKFCYDTVLYYAQDLLMKRGILTTRASFDDKLPGSGTTNSHHVRHPSEDFILGSGGLAKLQSGMEQMGLTTQDVAQTADIGKTTPPSEPSCSPQPEAGSGDSEKMIDKVPSPVPTNVPENEPVAELSMDPTESSEKLLPSITSILDPSNFTLDGAGSPARRKITKENFASSKGSLTNTSADSADPLSQLDPLWSLKK